MNYSKYYSQGFLNDYLYKLLFLYFDRIGVSEGININKTSASKEYDTCHYWYFLEKSLSIKRMSAMGVMIY